MPNMKPDFNDLKNDLKQEIARNERFNKRFAFFWLAAIAAVPVFVISVVVFACWCLYHVLKAKGLVP